MLKITDIEQEFKKYIVLRDPHIVRVIMANIVGNYLLDRDPIWTMITTVSAGGKTTVIAPCGKIANIRFIDDLTEKSFLSGYKVKDKDGKMKDVSLLHSIGSGIMVFSDFTSILSKNQVSQGEILTQMRLIYDGNFSKQTGTGSMNWKGKVGFLGASTSSIYGYMESARAMGERFIYYWLDQPTNDEIAKKQEEVNISSHEITAIMSIPYANYFTAVKDFALINTVPQLKLTTEQNERVKNAAVFSVKGKTAIDRDFKSGKPDKMPEIAGIGRDLKSLKAMLHAMQLMECYEENNIESAVTDSMIDIIEKCAYSALNRERRKVLEILAKAEKELTASEIGTREGFGLSSDAVTKFLDPLHAVGLVQKRVGAMHKWYISEEDIKAFIIKVSVTFHDGVSNPVTPSETSSDDVDDQDADYQDADYQAQLDKELENF